VTGIFSSKLTCRLEGLESILVLEASVADESSPSLSAGN
jgi:hypothetical protein